MIVRVQLIICKSPLRLCSFYVVFCEMSVLTLSHLLN